MTTLSTELETALGAYADSAGIDRDEALKRILSEWLERHGYLKQDEPADEEATRETVQYPEFMDDASGGAGG